MLNTFYIVAILLVCNGQLFAQQEIEVRGKVINQKNEGVPGTNILIKGTSTGTVVDIEGNFKIRLPLGKTSLIFAFIGYKLLDQEIILEKGYAYTLDVILVQDKGWRKRVVSYLTLKKEALNPI